MGRPKADEGRGGGRAAAVVRLAVAGAAAVVATWFVWAYCANFYHNLVVHFDLALPWTTEFVVRMGPWAWLVPVWLLVIGAVCLARRRAAVVVALVTALLWLFAVAWPLFCLWAWQVPFVRLTSSLGTGLSPAG